VRSPAAASDLRSGRRSRWAISMPPTARRASPWPSSSAMSPDRPMSRACHLSQHTITEADRSCPMPSLRFTKDHEWVRQEGDLAVLGITDYAQSQLVDVVYVELP